MVDRWMQGHWMGKNTSSDEHIILTDVGTLVRTRSVRGLDAPMVLDLLLKTPRRMRGSPPALTTENLDEGVGMSSEPPRKRAAAESETPKACRSDLK